MALNLRFIVAAPTNSDEILLILTLIFTHIESSQPMVSFTASTPFPSSLLTERTRWDAVRPRKNGFGTQLTFSEGLNVVTSDFTRG